MKKMCQVELASEDKSLEALMEGHLFLAWGGRRASHWSCSNDLSQETVVKT